MLVNYRAWRYPMGWFLKDKNAEKSGASIGPSLVRIGDFLTESTLQFLPAGLSKRDLFGKLIGTLTLSEPDIALRSVLAREQIGSTLLENGVAIPHARLHGLTRIQAALGIVAAAAEPSAEDTRLCLLFLGPTDDMKGHLGFLASSAALFQSETLRYGLLRQKSVPEALEVIRAHEREARGALS
jgi:PTS system nitrogen regulatory IIA component